MGPYADERSRAVHESTEGQEGKSHSVALWVVGCS